MCGYADAYEPTGSRAALATDAERYLATDDLVWFGEPNTEPAGGALEGLPPDQRFAAEVDGADPVSYAGVYGVRPLELSVPGSHGDARPVPVAGLTYVGVHPDHRRQGVLRAMMRHHLEQTRAEGVAVSTLHASETEIYGRYGYGLAGLEFQLKLGRGTTLVAPYLDEEAARVGTRMSTISDPGMAERIRACDLRVGVREVGTLVFLEGVYCDGERHQGCDRTCLHLWREAWLRRVPDRQALKEPAAPAIGV
jgi:GNAT superfamily N-acetyltransferase